MTVDQKTDDKIEDMSGSSLALSPELTAEELAEIERKFDPETAFRATGTTLGFFIAAVLVAMSVYHFYASGFGLIRELLHRGIHLSFVLGLVFLLFGWRRETGRIPVTGMFRTPRRSDP